MNTLLAELGEKFIEVGLNGRELESRRIQRIPGEWESNHDEDGLIMDFDLGKYEYRLRPKVTYYRAYKHRGLLTLDSVKNVPWESVDSWVKMFNDVEWLFDYEVSE